MNTKKEMTVQEVLTNPLGQKWRGGAESHIHVWDKFLEVERGDTLELGGGFNSTPYLSSKLQSHEFLTLDNSQEWVDKVNESKWHVGVNHRVEHVPDWDVYDWEKITTQRGKRWKYIFVDHSPGDHRIFEVVRLLPFCDYMIIHDTDADRGKGGDYGWRFVERIPKYWVEYLLSWNVPTTTVCSRYFDPQNLVPKF